MNRVSGNEAIISWTPGAGSTQKIYIGANKTEVDAGCPGTSSPACLIVGEGLSMSVNNYDTGPILASGVVYYVRVVSFIDSTRPTTAVTTPYLSSCNLTPSLVSINAGQTQLFTLNVNSSPDIVNSTFASSNTGVARVTSPDASFPLSNNGNRSRGGKRQYYRICLLHWRSSSL